MSKVRSTSMRKLLIFFNLAFIVLWILISFAFVRTDMFQEFLDPYTDNERNLIDYSIWLVPLIPSVFYISLQLSSKLFSMNNESKAAKRVGIPLLTATFFLVLMYFAFSSYVWQSFHI